MDDVFHMEGDGLDLYLKRNFLTEAECAVMASLIDEEHAPSTVLGPALQDYRSSDSSFLDLKRHPLISEIDARILAFMGIDAKFGEGLEGQRYAPGQQFMPHYDFFHETEAYWPEQDRIGGQRTWTAIICLAAPEEGGGTLFPQAGIRIRPKVGNLLAWCNVSPDGDLNEQSLHSGEPVVAGTKYIMTKWFRERPILRREVTVSERPVLSEDQQIFVRRLIPSVAAEAAG